MYEMRGRLVLHRPGDSPGILSQVCTEQFTSFVCPTIIVTLNFCSSPRPASFAGHIFNFPIPYGGEYE